MIAVHPEATIHKALCKVDMVARVATEAQEAALITTNIAAIVTATVVAMATRVAATVVPAVATKADHLADLALHRAAKADLLLVVTAHHKVAMAARAAEARVVLPEVIMAVLHREVATVVPDAA